MTTNKTSRGVSTVTAERRVQNLRGENPTPPAKAIIPGKGVLVHFGGVASHA